jgi:voltage-gated potassium channel
MSATEQNEPSQEQPRIGFLEISVLVLSVYVLGALLVQTLFPLAPEVSALLDRIDFFVCIVFLTEFCVRFHRAPSKLRFMRWGWIDLISSIPLLDALRWGRLVRLIRILRILRAFRSARHLVGFLYRHRSRSIAATTILSAAVLIIFSSIAVLAFETEPASNIRTPFDAIWWAVSTMTTVGYGDKVPMTIEGKIVAMVLMVVGVGLFGVLTGLFARLFVEPDLRREDEDIKDVLVELRLLRKEVLELKGQISAKENPAKE